MITVFIILGLVVLSGHFLIRIINAYFPPNAIKRPMGDSISSPSSVALAKSDKSSIAAIVAAVDLFTGGKGKAEKIERIE